MVTVREWLSTQKDETTGAPLAKPGKGRFSYAAMSAVALAIANGMTFDEPEVAAPKAPKTPKPEKRVVMADSVKREPVVARTQTPVVKEPTPEVDPKLVREWADSVGLKVSSRGRISSEVVTQYLANNNGVVPVAQRREIAEAPRVRPESVAYGYLHPHADKPYETEILVALTSCAKCGKGIGWCKCANGPVCPSWMGSEIASLKKP